MPISFLFFLKKKKEVGERKKKKQVRSYQENPRVTHSVCSDFGNISFRNGLSNISGFSREKFRLCRKEIFEWVRSYMFALNSQRTYKPKPL